MIIPRAIAPVIDQFRVRNHRLLVNIPVLEHESDLLIFIDQVVEVAVMRAGRAILANAGSIVIDHDVVRDYAVVGSDTPGCITVAENDSPAAIAASTPENTRLLAMVVLVAACHP